MGKSSNSRKLERTALSLLMVTALLACGRPGTSPAASCSLCGSLNDVIGEISTASGSQSQMQGWLVTSFEHDTGIARLAEVDSAGIFTLSQMRTDHIQTLALLSPDYILQAVLSIPGTVAKTVLQWVQFQSAELPHLINQGTTITFANLNNLNVQSWTSSDQSGEGIPDGVAKFTGTSTTGSSSLNLVNPITGEVTTPGKAARPGLYLGGVTPTDRNGISNSVSPDVDGDGLINWLDPDDNGNGVYDIFDPDQNSDLINDLTPTGQNTDQWFTQGVDYFSVQFSLTPSADGSTTQTSLTFTTQVKADTSPIAVQIRGASTLLNNATVQTVTSSGTSSEAWDHTLADDGSGTRTFTRRVVLANAAVPSSFQVVFLELVFGTSQSPYYVEYPWTFPPVTPASITAQYDANTHTVELVGNPFGTVQSFVWTINVFDSKGVNVWTSASVPGSTRQFAVQSNILVTGATYTFSVQAESLDKIPGHPCYVISSQQYPLQ